MKKLIALCSLVFLLAACGGSDGGSSNGGMTDAEIRAGFPPANFLANCTFQEVEYVSKFDADGTYYICSPTTDLSSYEAELSSDGFNISQGIYIKIVSNKGYAWYYEDNYGQYDVFWLIYHDLNKI